MRPIDAYRLKAVLEKNFGHTGGASVLEQLIDEQPTIEPSTNCSEIPNSSDAVSRQQAIDEIKNYCENGCDIAEDNWCPSCQREQFIELLNALPSAQPKHKKGWWLPDNRPGGGFWVCSECKFPSEAFAANVLYKFCPNCGADMRGEKDG